MTNLANTNELYREERIAAARMRGALKAAGCYHAELTELYRHKDGSEMTAMGLRAGGQLWQVTYWCTTLREMRDYEFVARRIH